MKNIPEIVYSVSAKKEIEYKKKSSIDGTGIRILFRHLYCNFFKQIVVNTATIYMKWNQKWHFIIAMRLI